jgi:hypothetical protein
MIKSYEQLAKALDDFRNTPIPVIEKIRAEDSVMLSPREKLILDEFLGPEWRNTILGA